MIRKASDVLCNVLTVCRWRLELLGDDPAEHDEAIALVRADLARGERMLGDLSILLEAEDSDFLRQEPIDLEHLGHELVADVSRLAARDWRLDRADGAMLGDADLLREAVRKLADNAVQNTERNDVVAVAACVDGDEARLWVRDSGRGLSPADQARLHASEPSARADRHLRRGGLGLAIVGAIAAAHSGRLELESRPGEGSTFTIVLPRDAGGPALDDPPARLIAGSG